MGCNGPFSKHKYFNGLNSDGGMCHNSTVWHDMEKILLTIQLSKILNLEWLFSDVLYKEKQQYILVFDQLYINYISNIHIFSEIVIHFHNPRFTNKT